MQRLVAGSHTCQFPQPRSLLQKPCFAKHERVLVLHTCHCAQSASMPHFPGMGTQSPLEILHNCQASQSNWFLQFPGFGEHSCLLGWHISLCLSHCSSLSQKPAFGLHWFAEKSQSCQPSQSGSARHLFFWKAQRWSVPHVFSVSLQSASPLHALGFRLHFLAAVSQYCHALHCLSEEHPPPGQP